MSILIKGMAMPTRCEDCFCYRHNTEYDYAYCNISSVNVLGHGNARLNNCPLVEVPTPHGDLIDRDKLPIECITFSKRKMYRAGTDVVFVKDILDAPTIIEAEEETV